MSDPVASLAASMGRGVTAAERRARREALLERVGGVPRAMLKGGHATRPERVPRTPRPFTPATPRGEIETPREHAHQWSQIARICLTASAGGRYDAALASIERA